VLHLRFACLRAPFEGVKYDYDVLFVIRTNKILVYSLNSLNQRNLAKKHSTMATPQPAPPSSRLVVKSLGKNVTDEKLSQVFSPFGELTDSRVMKNNVGKSRLFGFVGYRRVEDAVRALSTMNRTYIGSSKISVEFAQARGVAPSPKEKPTKSSTANSELSGAASSLNMVVTASSGTATMHTSDSTTRSGNDQLKNDYLNSMRKRSASKCWANDLEGQGDGIISKGDEPKDAVTEDIAEDESIPEDLEDETIEERDSTSNLAFSSGLSDLAYLRQKSAASVSTSALQTRNPKRAKTSSIPEEKSEPEPLADTEPTGRVLVRNVPYSVDESDLQELFSQFGNVTEVSIPIDEARRQKGIAFVQLSLPEEAERATAYSGSSFQGRCLSIVHAAPREPKEPSKVEKQLSGAYKQVKDLERKRKAGETLGWNAAHVRSDAVVDSMAARLGVAKGDFLADTDGNMAVRLALGETHLIAENREYFLNEGVDLNTLEATNSTAKALARSSTVVVVKNLPTTSNTAELLALFGKFGALSRLLLPPSKTVALVEFVEASEAKRAFKSLAYKRFQNVPLYLEWAPLQALRSLDKSQKGEAAQAAAVVEPKSELLDGGDAGGDDVEDNDLSVALISGPASTLFVKNLSFSATEAKLRAFFEKAGPVRAVSLPKKPVQKNNQSSAAAGCAGYGFVEFRSVASLEVALRDLQGRALDGRMLEMKRSEKRLSGTARPSSEGTKSAPSRSAEAPKTKLLVKNVAFQANVKELRELFGFFGALKSVRMPKKHDGAHRGFAFVAFTQAHEAQEAKQRLASTHLYGRHLVIDWVEDGTTDDVALARASASKSVAVRDKQRKTGSGSAEKLEDILTAKVEEGSDGED